MSSLINSWLFADQLEKPEELLTYRAINDSGLRVENIKFRGTEILTSSFLETAIGDKYICNNYHNALFRWHVLGETKIIFPGNPSYFSKSFYANIREVLEEKGWVINKMSSSEWYTSLLEKYANVKSEKTDVKTSKVSKLESRLPLVSC